MIFEVRSGKCVSAMSPSTIVVSAHCFGDGPRCLHERGGRYVVSSNSSPILFTKLLQIYFVADVERPLSSLKKETAVWWSGRPRSLKLRRSSTHSLKRLLKVCCTLEVLLFGRHVDDFVKTSRVRTSRTVKESQRQDIPLAAILLLGLLGTCHRARTFVLVMVLVLVYGW